MTDREQAVLEALYDRQGGGIYSHEIAGYAGIAPDKIGGVVTSLIRKGYVERIPKSGDTWEHLILADRVVTGITGTFSQPGPKQFFLKEER